jgi:hypothetical protein
MEDEGGGFYRLETIPSNAIFEAIRQVRELISVTLHLQAEQISRLEQNVELLRNQHLETEEAARYLLELIENTLADGGGIHAPSIRSISCSIRNLTAATHAGDVFEVLAAEAARMNVRSAVFDVRGMAAWGSTAGGFGPDLSNRDLHSLVVPLNQENPFRQVFETAEPLETNAEGLGKNRPLLDKLNPGPNAHIFLFPVWSAGAVTAILCAEGGERENSILVDGLKVLTEFAGAQLDRLIALGGGFASVEAPAREEQLKVPEPAAPLAPETEIAGPDRNVNAEIPEVAVLESSSEAGPSAPAREASASLASPETQEALAAEPELGVPQAPNFAEASEEEQKVHRDAQRFSRLLVSEIELYNKEKVAEGRKNKDLYQRLKKDIDRSRQTYDKRFGNTVIKQVDYFHEELVRALARNDPSLLGSDYPGPSA